MLSNPSFWFASCNYFIWVLIFLFSGCTSDDKKGGAKFRQYFIKGESLYVQHCSNCHQKNGSGLGLLYPPIDKSDYINNNYEAVVCLIRNGKKGVLIVNGKNYNKEMPAISSLSDLEVAQITTYIYNNWGREVGIADVKEVNTILTNCKE